MKYFKFAKGQILVEQSFRKHTQTNYLYCPFMGPPYSHIHNFMPKVFHRDIKSPNILLDKNGNAKMADFGLACLSHSSTQRVHETTGTIGYADPLYVKRGVVTEGSEV